MAKQEKETDQGSLVPKSTAVVGNSYGEDAFKGFEDLGQEFYSVPLIGIIQKMSPQVDPDAPKYIPEAKAGAIMNNVTNELFDGKVGVPVIPVHVERSFVEWIPRDEGGGYVGAYEPGDPVVLNALRDAGRQGRPKTVDGNDLVETFYLYALLVRPDGGYDQVIIPFASSNIKVIKKWLTTARGITLMEQGRRITPPLFAHLYALTTTLMTKDTHTWYIFSVSFAGDDAAASRLAPTDELYQAAKAFRDLVTSGATRKEGLEQEAEASVVEDLNSDVM